MPNGPVGVLGVTVREPVVTAPVSVQENVWLKINAKFLLLSFVLEKVTRTRLVPTGAAQVITRDSLSLNCLVHKTIIPLLQLHA